MEYIYSRPRIRIVKFNSRSNKNPKDNRKLIFIVVIIVLLIFTLILVKAISPLFNHLCREKALSTATIITNKVTSIVMTQYQYSDFIKIHRNTEDNIKMIQSNISEINNFISKVTEEIQKEINNTQAEDISIRMGSFTGISILAGRGPKVPIKISTVGNINTDVKSEFKNAGINQTLHRLYLNMECEISILTPFNTINEKIINQLIIAENIIVGNIPETYYNLNGITSDDVMEVMQ